MTPTPRPGPDPDDLRDAVERTLAARTGRFVHTVLADGVAALAEGTYDLPAGRVQALTRVMTSSVDDDGTAWPDPLAEPVPAVFAPGVLHQAGPADEDGEREWYALEHPGLTASPLAALWWLLGAALASGTSPRGALSVVLQPSAVLAALHRSLRDGAETSLEEVGMLPEDAPVPAEVGLDEQGRVRTVDLVLPGLAGPRLRLELHDLGAPVRIDLPAVSRASTLEDFVGSVVDDRPAGADG